MTRDEALAAITYAAYHDDEEGVMEIYLDNGISPAACHAAEQRGRQSRVDGVQCGCGECKRARTVAPLERTGM